MEVYRSETRETLRRFLENRISRAECIAALDSALLAAIPDLDPADLPHVQAILAENSRYLTEIDEMKNGGHDVSQVEAGSLRFTFCLNPAGGDPTKVR